MKKTGKIASGVLIVMVVFSVMAPLLPIADPERIDLDALREAPSAAHLFGTDSKGRDIFSRVVFGGRVSISVAAVAAFTSAFIGFVVGLAAGYCGGKTDTILMALVDFILSFPSLLLAIAVSVVLPPGIYTVMIAIAFVGWTSFARIVRGQVLTYKEMPFVEAARSMGCGHARIAILHIAPLCLPISLIMMGIKLGGFVLTEATLGFLGLGVQPPTPTWGSMVSANRAYILSAPWTVFFPGLAIFVTAFCCNLLGEYLKERSDLRRSLRY
ncbi:MAG: dipeptide/oligopeptide/nickel ABC transporter permease [Nitrospirae bacterium]|nr:MAG: dipeptide/oligopeptide/nickel ABC transporter permease [Nitrospirota bacterium]